MEKLTIRNIIFLFADPPKSKRKIKLPLKRIGVLTEEDGEFFKKQKEMLITKEKRADMVTSDAHEDHTEADGPSDPPKADENASEQSPTQERDTDLPPSTPRVTDLLPGDPDEEISFSASDVPKIADVKITKTQIVS